jgi:hypothetical protein
MEAENSARLRQGYAANFLTNPQSNRNIPSTNPSSSLTAASPRRQDLGGV